MHTPSSQIQTDLDQHGGQLQITLPVLLPRTPGENNANGDLLTHLQQADAWLGWLHLQLVVQDMVRFWPEELAGVHLAVTSSKNGNQLQVNGTSASMLEISEEADRFESVLEAFENNLAGSIDVENPTLVNYLYRMFPKDDPTTEFAGRDELFERALASLPDSMASLVKAQALEQHLEGRSPSQRGPRL